MPQIRPRSCELFDEPGTFKSTEMTIHQPFGRSLLPLFPSSLNIMQGLSVVNFHYDFGLSSFPFSICSKRSCIRLYLLNSRLLIGTMSLRNSLINAAIIKSIRTANGNAAMSDAVCNASNPPANKSTPAIAASNTPQIILTRIGGDQASSSSHASQYISC